MNYLLKELQLHAELNFLSYAATLNDAAQLLESEYWKIMAHSCEIFDEKYPEKIKKWPKTNDDIYYDKILDKLCERHSDEYFSFSWLESYAQCQNLIKPLYDDHIYKDGLKTLVNLKTIPTTFDDKIFFLATGIRYYVEFLKQDTLSIEKEIPYILRVDRVLSHIQKEISAALASSASRVSGAVRDAKGHFAKEINSFEETDNFIKAINTLQEQYCDKNINLSRFITKITIEMGKECDGSTERKRLKKKYGVTANNFPGRLKNKTLLETP